MPSRTFFNLSDEKRERLIQGAMEEFVRVPLSKASVSNIIANAEISRGSFYQYFEDIHDSYLYLIGLFHQNIHALFQKCLKENDGHFMKGIALFGDKYIKAIMENKKVGFYKNMYLDMNYSLNRKMNALLVNIEETKSKKDYKKVMEVIDFQSVKTDSKIEIQKIIDFCMNMVNQTIIEGFYMEWTVAQTQETFQSRLKWISEGVSR